MTRSAYMGVETNPGVLLYMLLDIKSSCMHTRRGPERRGGQILQLWAGNSACWCEKHALLQSVRNSW